MATKEAKRCKGCKAPLLSAFEQDQGKCTACLRKERMRTAAKVVGDVKTAKAHTIKRKPLPQEVYQAEQEVYPQGQANSVQMSCKVSSETHEKAQAIIKRNSQTQSGWLRSLIEREVYPQG
jgi:hypothetical protein